MWKWNLRTAHWPVIKLKNSEWVLTGDGCNAEQFGSWNCHNHLTFGFRGSTFSSLMGCLCPSSTTGIDYLEGDLGQTEFTPSGCLSLSTVTEPLLGMLMSIFSRMRC